MGQYRLSFDDEHRTIAFLFKIYRTFKQAIIDTNIWGPFQDAKLEFDVSIELSRGRFDEEQLRGTLGFQDI
jgi:hypothetical protein